MGGGGGGGVQGQIQDFSKGVAFVRGGVTFHCLITKIFELGASYVFLMC